MSGEQLSYFYVKASNSDRFFGNSISPNFLSLSLSNCPDLITDTLIIDYFRIILYFHLFWNSWRKKWSGQLSLVVHDKVNIEVKKKKKPPIIWIYILSILWKADKPKETFSVFKMLRYQRHKWLMWKPVFCNHCLRG